MNVMLSGLLALAMLCLAVEIFIQFSLRDIRAQRKEMAVIQQKIVQAILQSFKPLTPQDIQAMRKEIGLRVFDQSCPGDLR